MRIVADIFDHVPDIMRMNGEPVEERGDFFRPLPAYVHITDIIQRFVIIFHKNSDAIAVVSA